MRLEKLKKKLVRQAKGYLRQEPYSANSFRTLCSIMSTVKKLTNFEANQ